MVDNLDYLDERSSQHYLEDDEPSSSPAEVAITISIRPSTRNGNAEPNHTKPSTVQLHTQKWPATVRICSKYAHFAEIVLY